MAGKNKLNVEIQETVEAIQDYRKAVEKKQNNEFNPLEKKESTRSKIALVFVWGYFLLLGIVFVTTLINNGILLFKFGKNSGDILLNPKDVILIITGAIGSPLGFVLGYYFKGLEEKR